MPQLNDATESLLREGRQLSKGTRRFWHRFSDFAARDNVLEVALGLILAAAFTAVINSFVSDIILPPFSLLPFLDKQLDEKFAVLRGGPNHTSVNGTGYNTLKQALADGAVVMAYGSFIDKVVNFLGIGLSLFMVAQLYSWLSHDNIIHETVKCKYCRKRISIKAKRCVNCTSWLDGREDHV